MFEWKKGHRTALLNGTDLKVKSKEKNRRGILRTP